MRFLNSCFVLLGLLLAHRSPLRGEEPSVGLPVIARFQQDEGGFAPPGRCVLIYANQEVLISAGGDQKWCHGLLAKSDQKEFQELIEAVEQIRTLKKSYSVGAMDCGPEAAFTIPYLYDTRSVRILGLSGKELIQQDIAGSSWPPQALLQLHAWFCKLKPEMPEDWPMDTLRVCLKPLPTTGGKSIWPIDLPGPDSPASYVHDDLRILYFSGDAAELAAQALKSGQIVRFGKQSYRIHLTYVRDDDNSFKENAKPQKK